MGIRTTQLLLPIKELHTSIEHDRKLKFPNYPSTAQKCFSLSPNMVNQTYFLTLT